MKRALAAAIAFALPAVGSAESAAQSAVPEAATLFARKCGLCHAAGGTGAFMLGRRLGPERALLTDRRDLAMPFVAAVVRQGLGNMPRLTRVEVTDEELATLAAWLSRPREEPVP